ncbi:putative lipoprotein [Pseudomonas aeruginosa]|nr:putative lipoprotein [Pseudomonas aeruginosa]
MGCSNGQVKPENYSGFIGDYSTLAPATAPSGAPLLRWVDPQADVRRYQRIYIEPSRFYPVPKPNDKVSAKTLADITTYYDQALRRELGKSLPLASAPARVSWC